MEPHVVGYDDSTSHNLSLLPSEKALQEISPYPQDLGGNISSGPDWIPAEWSGSESANSPLSSPRTIYSTSFYDPTVINESFDFGPWGPLPSDLCMTGSSDAQNTLYPDCLSIFGAGGEGSGAVNYESNIQPLNQDIRMDFDERSDSNHFQPQQVTEVDISKRSASYKPAWKTTSEVRSNASSNTRPLSIESHQIPKQKISVQIEKGLSTPQTRSFGSDSGMDQSPEPPRSRITHNLTEKRYRTRLNGQFETLLAILPSELVAAYNPSCCFGPENQRISKSEVLILAKEHIEAMEEKRIELERQNQALLHEIARLKQAWEGI